MVSGVASFSTTRRAFTRISPEKTSMGSFAYEKVIFSGAGNFISSIRIVSVAGKDRTVGIRKF